MYVFSLLILSAISTENVCINFPPAPTHSDHESNFVGSVAVLLQKPEMAEQTVNAKINFISIEVKRL